MIDHRSTCKIIIKKKKKSLPRIAIQASFFLLWVASSDNVTIRGTPPTPVKSAPEFPKRIQSIRLWPGASAVLFRGLPANIQRKRKPNACLLRMLKIRLRNRKIWNVTSFGSEDCAYRRTRINCKDLYHWVHQNVQNNVFLF